MNKAKRAELRKLTVKANKGLDFADRVMPCRHCLASIPMNQFGIVAPHPDAFVIQFNWPTHINCLSWNRNISKA